METYTGQLGVVLTCNVDTARRAMYLTNKIPDGNAIALGTQHRPHVTLYHSKLQDVPAHAVSSVLKSIARELPLSLEFSQTAVFGGKFLFWDIERTPVLMELHEKALSLSRYFTPAGKQQADKEKIALAAAEDENVRTYGHPLVRDLWRPHITLGYYPQGIDVPAQQERHHGAAYRAAFVRVGDFGTVAEIISEV